MDTDGGDLQVVATPGHCDDHIVLYDRKEKVLLAGDAFMGSYFATPNPDVDSHKWLVSLERLMELEIEILVEGHGHIHTLRADVPDFPGVVIRQDPKIAVAQKLDYLRWLREQIESGFQEQLPVRVIEASCFPGGKRTSWESCATDECIRLLVWVTSRVLNWCGVLFAPTQTASNRLRSTPVGKRVRLALFRLTTPSEDEVRRFMPRRGARASHI